ncbi:MAG TPA: cytochrome c maturation protein CcmE [Methylibium sp.]|uniref:cytochrome c maturation protein CcmE n=1 Tax=Methylibium sp. TaxID=2067992 RepID=UPI002DBAA7E2|nr:cytochrome c maturation protein CcmE [Methylibium sp.]HEU4457869.1 cytochrome c maturation protein CcmE [Methylibium sp.]
MKPRHKRIAIVVGGLAALGVATALVLNALNSNLVFFYSPSQIESKEAPVNRSFRIGGMVEEGSVKRDGVNVQFVVTDTVKTTPVRYAGILPDLFKEGKGVVAQGRLDNGVFVASEVLAKHDENYMPPEAAEALAKAKGQQGQGQQGPQPAGTLANGGAGKPAAYGAQGDPR